MMSCNDGIKDGDCIYSILVIIFEGSFLSLIGLGLVFATGALFLSLF